MLGDVCNERCTEGTLSRYISSLTVYEIYKLSLETEGKQTADLQSDLLR